MTSLTDNTIDMLIKRVRRELLAENFAFMTAYPPQAQPNPIGKYVVTVENSEVKEAAVFIGGRVSAGERGKLYEETLCVRTYAPMKTSGSALLRASSLVADALERCDTQRAICGIELFSLCYDTAVRTTYRDMKVRLQYLLSEEEQDD